MQVGQPYMHCHGAMERDGTWVGMYVYVCVCLDRVGK